jgi:hypothetical protein
MLIDVAQPLHEIILKCKNLNRHFICKRSKYEKNDNAYPAGFGGFTGVPFTGKTAKERRKKNQQKRLQYYKK